MNAEDRQVIRETVRETLTSLGVDHTNPLEVQRDFAALREMRLQMEDPEYVRDQLHLRRWRKAVDTMESRGLASAVRFVIISVLALAAVGAGVKFGIFR